MKRKKLDIAVIGLGTFGYELAVKLSAFGHGVLAIDLDEKKIHAIKDKVQVAVRADITDSEVLKKMELDKFDKVIFGMSSALESIILAVIQMRKMGVKHIIGKANTEIKKEILHKIGVDEVILPEISTADRLAEKINNPRIIDKFSIDEKHSLVEIAVPAHMVGKSLVELDLRNKYNISVIMIKQPGETRLVIDPNYRFAGGDIVFAVGDEQRINRIFS